MDKSEEKKQEGLKDLYQLLQDGKKGRVTFYTDAGKVVEVEAAHKH